MHKPITLTKLPISEDVTLIGIAPDKVSETVIKLAKQHLLYEKATQITWVNHRHSLEKYTIQVLATIQDKDLFWYKLQQTESNANNPDPYLQTR